MISGENGRDRLVLANFVVGGCGLEYGACAVMGGHIIQELLGSPQDLYATLTMSRSATHLVESIVFVLLDVSCVARELEIENLQSTDVLTDMSNLITVIQSVSIPLSSVYGV
jgi:hypothetical protein